MSAIAKENASLAETIIGIEKTALERWNSGDPQGYMEIYAPGISYFDPFLESRLDGFDAINQLYGGLDGQVQVDDYKMLNPKVDLSGSIAVLSFNLESLSKGIWYKWNCTEVYQMQEDNSWKIIHSHWSFTKPEL